MSRARKLGVSHLVIAAVLLATGLQKGQAIRLPQCGHYGVFSPQRVGVRTEGVSETNWDSGRCPAWNGGTAFGSGGVARGPVLLRSEGRLQLAAVTSGWRQAGIYGLEFGAAALGTCIAATASFAVAEIGNPDPTEPGRQFVLGLATYAVTSALLSSASTHLTGKLMHQRHSFAHALVGGAVGGFVGAVAIRQAVWGAPPVLLPVGLALPPLCAVVAYNIW